MSDAPPIPPSTRLSVSLTLEQWRKLSEILSELQFKQVAMFIGQIDYQCSQQMQQMSAAQRGNGAVPEERSDARQS